MDASVFLTLAGAVNRLVSVLKAPLTNIGKQSGWSDQFYDIVLQLIAIVAGIILALIANANLVPETLGVDVTVGKIITGVFIGLGSDILNAVLDFLYTSQKKPADSGGTGGTGGS